MYLRAFLLFNIKASKKEEEKIEEMTKQIYGGKTTSDSPSFPFSLPCPARGVAFR
jgi:hypothetical protein